MLAEDGSKDALLIPMNERDKYEEQETLVVGLWSSRRVGSRIPFATVNATQVVTQMHKIILGRTPVRGMYSMGTAM